MRQRPARYFLGGNKGTETPVNLLFFDTESRKPIPLGQSAGVKLSLRLWTAVAVRLEAGKVTRRQVYRGHTPDEFWTMHESRQRPREPLWAFAHNLGFDLTQLHFWHALETRRFTSGPVPRPPCPKTGRERKPWHGGLCLEARPTWAIVRGARGTCRFVDTGNYWPTKLDQVGAAFGLPKLPMPDWDAPDEDWFAYCQRDSEVCEAAVLDLMKRWRDEDCGVFKMTAPSLSMAHFMHTAKCRRKGSEKINIVLEPNHPAGKFEREAYYGGRVQPFYLGTHPGPVHHLDCTSLYLSVMSAGLFPRKRVGILIEPTPARLHRAMGAHGAVAQVLIRSNGDTYPVRLDGVQQHCRGTFWTWLAGPELWRALSNRHVVQVREHCLYSLQALFTGWADHWHGRKIEARREGHVNAGEEEFAKLVGNSLGGKWAQKGEYWMDRPDVPARMNWGQWLTISGPKRVVCRFRAVGGHTQEKVTGREPGHAFPAISAYITAYAREYMRSVFAVCPPKSILYTATDSLICTTPAVDALSKNGLVDPDGFGKFRVEGTYESCRVDGPNWYTLNGRQTKAGLHGRPRPFKSEPDTVEVWERLPTIIGKRPDGTVIIDHVKLKPPHATLKGVTGPDGWVDPFALVGTEPFQVPAPKRRRLH